MCSGVFAWKTRIFTGFKLKQETRWLPSPVQTRRCGNLYGKRRAASATAGRIRILESKAGTHDAAHVVDLDAVQVLCAEHVDEHAHALLVDHEIAFARLLFNIQAVLKARAPSGYHSHTEPSGLG